MKKSLLCLLVVLTVQPVMGRIAEDQATNAIVGEAAGQPYIVKLGVAGALRNRGTLRGVYGYNALHNQYEPKWVWVDAKRAWRESAQRDITHGATHFGSADDVAKGTFTSLQLVCVLGTDKDATYFFK
jgi:hypothetical protein